MPEANILRLTANRLGEALIGLPLVRAELRWPSVGGTNLVGTSVIESRSLGKHLLTRLDNGYTLHTHLRMDGFWRVAKTGSPGAAGRATQIRAVLATERWTALGWHLGMLDLVRTPDEHTLIGHLGPDILDPGFVDSTASDGGLREVIRRIFGPLNQSDPCETSEKRTGLSSCAQSRSDDIAGSGLKPETAIQLVAPGTPICAALLDQRVVAGIGTIFMADSLYETRTWPWISVGELGPRRTARVLVTASRLLHRSIAQARAGGMRAAHRSVHGQHGKYCPRCNQRIAVGSFAGPDVPPDQGTGNRIVFYCPGCQVPNS